MLPEPVRDRAASTSTWARGLFRWPRSLDTFAPKDTSILFVGQFETLVPVLELDKKWPAEFCGVELDELEVMAAFHHKVAFDGRMVLALRGHGLGSNASRACIEEGLQDLFDDAPSDVLTSVLAGDPNTAIVVTNNWLEPTKEALAGGENARDGALSRPLDEVARRHAAWGVAAHPKHPKPALWGSFDVEDDLRVVSLTIDCETATQAEKLEREAWRLDRYGKPMMEMLSGETMTLDVELERRDAELDITGTLGPYEFEAAQDLLHSLLK